MKYYVARNGAPAGPFELWQLRYEGVNADTLIWCSGMSGWTKASEIAEVAEAIAGESFPPAFDAVAYNMKYGGYNRFGAQFGQAQPWSDDGFYPRPNNYLAEAIVVTIMCFPFTGIFAIIKASQVNKLYERRQYAEAENASIQARNWVIGTIILGIAVGSLLMF